MAFFNYDIEHHQTLQSLTMSKQNQSNSKKIYYFRSNVYFKIHKKFVNDIFEKNLKY